METDGNCILVDLKSERVDRMDTSTEMVDEDEDQGEESVGTGWRCKLRRIKIFVTQIHWQREDESDRK